ncbi:MAG: hypothetical protein WA880_01130 [Ornithinimicrobium sp.]
MAAHPCLNASGMEALALTYDLLRRVRMADPRAGTWEAADLQWWWRAPRATDDLQQTFVVDKDGPLATVRLTAWSKHLGLEVIRSPEAWVAVAERAWRMAQQHAVTTLEALVAPDDEDLIDWIEENDFAAAGEDGTVAWPLLTVPRHRCSPRAIGSWTEVREQRASIPVRRATARTWTTGCRNFLCMNRIST